MEKLSLKNREWKEFLVRDLFNIYNSKAYHKTNLQENKKGIAYISRTNLNNGLEAVVVDNNYKKNPANTIVFGAENASFFYEPFEFITGNKMYYMYNENLNRYTGLFIQYILNSSLQNCGFGYGKGLTGSRMKRRSILVPVNKKDLPDWQFMGKYMRDLEQKKIAKYKSFIANRIKNSKSLTLEKLRDKEWKEFFIEKIFHINSGKRLTKTMMKKGKTPFIGASDSNNGITEWTSNTNISLDSNILGVNYNGSVVENFYHPYKALFSDDVKRFTLRERNGNKYLYLFFKNIILKQKNKYEYGYKFNEKRMKRQKILLPINAQNEPDYEYMEQYMRVKEHEKLLQYLEYIEKKK